MRKFTFLFLLIFMVACDDTRSLENIASPTPSKTASQEEVKSDNKTIVGEFSEKKAFEFLYGNYNEEQKEANWRPTKEELAKISSSANTSSQIFENNEFYITPVLVAPFLEAGTEKNLLITAALPPEYDCHACAPMISAALFKKNANNWELEFEQKYLFELGSYGTAPDAKLVKIGNDKYGVLFETGDTGQGYTYEGLSLVTKLDKGFQKILEVETGGDNSGTCGDELGPCWKFSSKYEFIPGKNPNFFDFKIMTSGTKGEENNIVPVNENKLYQFDGKEYKAIP